MRIVAVSDTHSKMPVGGVPDGDILIHAGDLTKRGTLEEIAAAGEWLRSLPHPVKIAIAGNHDFGFERDASASREAFGPGIHYLEDSSIVVNGLMFWGSPWQPRFCDLAYNLDRGEPLAKKWALIPAATDVLITHGPPYGILDATATGEMVGCRDLAIRVDVVRPRVHVFGHIHEGAGMFRDGRTVFVNASVCDLRYRPLNPARVIDL